MVFKRRKLKQETPEELEAVVATILINHKKSPGFEENPDYLEVDKNSPRNYGPCSFIHRHDQRVLDSELWAYAKRGKELLSYLKSRREEKLPKDEKRL